MTLIRFALVYDRRRSPNGPSTCASVLSFRRHCIVGEHTGREAGCADRGAVVDMSLARCSIISPSGPSVIMFRIKLWKGIGIDISTWAIVCEGFVASSAETPTSPI